MRARAQLRAAAPRAAYAPHGRQAQLGPVPQPGCRLVLVHDAPPIAFRATPEAVYLVGTAASPVGDDHISLEVEVEAGACLKLRSAASMIAWASAGSTLEVNVSVAAGGRLDWHLQPMIASAGCSFSQRARVKLAAGAGLRWTEEVVLGRHGEGPGRLSLRLDVDIDDHPLLRHQLELGPGVPGWDGPAVLGANRAVGLVLWAGTGVAAGGAGAPSPGAGTNWAVMPLAGPGMSLAGPGMPHGGPGVLVSAVGPDLAGLRSSLGQALRHSPSSDK